MDRRSGDSSGLIGRDSYGGYEVGWWKASRYSECDRYSVILLGESNCVLVVDFCQQTWYDN